MTDNDINLCKEAIISISDIIEKLSNQVIDLENKLIESESENKNKELKKNKELEKNNIIKQKKTQNIQNTDEYKIRLIRSRRANNY